MFLLWNGCDSESNKVDLVLERNLPSINFEGVPIRGTHISNMEIDFGNTGGESQGYFWVVKTCQQKMIFIL